MREHGNIDFDFKYRCALHTSHGYDVIFYGLRVRDHNEVFAMTKAQSMPSPYAELSVGGRRPGSPIEMERGQHFFTKHLGKEKIGGVQGHSDASGIGARDAKGGAGGAQEVKTGAEGTGGYY